jgi:hypothetical protein
LAIPNAFRFTDDVPIQHGDVRPGEDIRRHLLNDVPFSFVAPPRARWADMVPDGGAEVPDLTEDMWADARVDDDVVMHDIATFTVEQEAPDPLDSNIDISEVPEALEMDEPPAQRRRVALGGLRGGMPPNHIEDLDMGSMSVENRVLMKLGRPHSQTSTGSSCSSVDDDIVAALQDVHLSTSGDTAGTTATSSGAASSSGAAPLAVRSVKRNYTEIAPHGIREPDFAPIR